VSICFGQKHSGRCRGFNLFGLLCTVEFEAFEIIVIDRENICDWTLEDQGSDTSCSLEHLIESNATFR
jgi:hypothetical protein